VTLKGRVLSLAALAQLPGDARRRVRNLRKAQIISALQQCLSARFAGGVVLLRDLAHYLLPREAVINGLDALVFVMQVHGLTGENLVLVRVHRAEALEQANRFAEAAALYKQNIMDDLATPGCIPSPPLMWQYYGIALRKSGDEAGALAAYKHALRLLDSGVRCVPDTAAWRETLRLRILIVMRTVMHTPEGVRDANMQLYRNVNMEDGCPLGRRPEWSFRCEGASAWAECITTGRRWAVAEYMEDDIIHMHVVQLPNRVGRYVPSPYLPRRGGFATLTADNAEELPFAGRHTLFAENREREAAQDAVFKHGDSAAKLPPMQTTCGNCGKRGASSSGMKMCSRCRQVSYCSKECQVSAWHDHKDQCHASAAMG